jgi:hypothetical protein
MKPPAATWLRQRSLVGIEVGALVVLGIGIAAYFLPGSRIWIDYFVGGLVALALALAIGGLYTVHDSWEQHRKLYGMNHKLSEAHRELSELRKRQAQNDLRDLRDVQATAENAFGLGYYVSSIPDGEAEIRDQRLFLQSFCKELALRLPLATSEKLFQPALPNQEEIAALSAEVRQEVERVAPLKWGCFFHLGATIAWLQYEVDNKRSLRRVGQELQQIQTDQSLRSDARYASAVDELTEVIRSVTYDGHKPSEGQQFAARFNSIFFKLPEMHVELRSTPFPMPITEWYWVRTADGAPAATCFVGEQSVYTTVAVADGSIQTAVTGYYQVSTGAGTDEVEVAKEADHWRCSLDGPVTVASPCPHLDLVLTVTDGGKPITHARTVLVRHEEIGK